MISCRANRDNKGDKMSSVFSNMTITPINNTKGSIRGNGKVTIGGAVEVRFTVFNGKNGVWAKLPVQADKVKKDDKGYPVEYPQVKIPEKEVYQEFQKMVADEYAKTAGTAAPDQGQPTAGQGPQSSDGVPW